MIAYVGARLGLHGLDAPDVQSVVDRLNAVLIPEFGTRFAGDVEIEVEEHAGEEAPRSDTGRAAAIAATWDEWLKSDDHLHNCPSQGQGQTCCAEHAQKTLIHLALSAVDGVHRSAVKRIGQHTRFCPYCGTQYELPPMKDGRIESTRDIPPPAKVAIYAVDYGQRMPDFKNGPVDIVHYCEHGVPKPAPEVSREP